MPNFVAFGQPVAEIWQFTDFEYGSRPSSWISYVRVWFTHEEHLVVFIVVQNLVGIDAVVSITEVFKFCEFGFNMFIHPLCVFDDLAT